MSFKIESAALPAKDTHGLAFQLRHNRRLVINVLILNLAYICFGYDASVIGIILAMPPFIKTFGTPGPDGVPYLPATRTSVITATRTSASIPAIFVCAYGAMKFGRRNTNWIGCFACLLGTALQTGASSVTMITVGLTIANFGYFVMVSMSSTLAIEIAPVQVRGMVGCLSVVGIGLGGILSSGIGWATSQFAGDMSFRVPLGVQNFWPILTAVLLPFIMDSPTTYLINGDDPTAEKSLRLVRQGYTDEAIAEEMATLRLQAQLRKDEESVRWTEAFQGVNLRRTLLATFLGVVQQFSGSIFASSYATIFLAGIGSSGPFTLVFGLNVLILGGSLLGLALVGFTKRRTIVLVSFLGLMVLDTAIGGLGFGDPSNTKLIKAMSALLLIFGFFFSMTMNPLTWLNAAELPTARLRTVTNAFVLLCISLSNLTMTYVLPFIANADAGNLGPKTFLIFAGCMLVGLIIAYFTFPESAGRTAAELDRMFEDSLPARRFTQWQWHEPEKEGSVASKNGVDVRVSDQV